MKTNINNTNVVRTQINENFWIDSFHNDKNIVVKTVTSEGSVSEYFHDDNNQLIEYLEYMINDTSSNVNVTSHYKIWYQIINNIQYYIGVDLLTNTYEIGTYGKFVDHPEDEHFYYQIIFDWFMLNPSIISLLKKFIDDVKLDVGKDLIPKEL